jgi:hypothetical protein
MCDVCDEDKANPGGLEALLKMLGGPPADREQAAQLEMDEQIQTMLDFVTERENIMVRAGLDVTDTPCGIRSMAEGMAGLLMYQQRPSAIAFTAALLAIRYRELLEKWEDLASRVDHS